MQIKKVKEKDFLKNGLELVTKADKWKTKT